MSKPTYEELEAQVKQLAAQLELSVAAERAWETTMMRVCGEDGPLSVAGKFNQLAAENAALKSAIKSLSTTAEECELNGDELRYIVGTDEFERLTDMLDETPATDAILASLRAEARKQGAIFAANRMLAAWDAGFVEDTPENAADIARAILSVTEFMDDAPEGDFDRSFADEMLEAIAAQLRSQSEQVKGVQS